MVNMTTEDQMTFTERRGILGWLGLGRTSAAKISQLSALAEQIRLLAPGTSADIIAGIADFHAQHDLSVCPFSLGIAFDYVTHSDPLIVRLIDDRVSLGQTISTEWLKQVRNADRADTTSDDLQRKFAEIERHLVDFGATATAARKATRDYGSSLEGHAQQLDSAKDIHVPVSELLGLVRVMIDKTSEMEREMARSEQKARSLRRKLEVAVRSAEEDELTGLPNRRAFEKLYESEYAEAREEMEPLVIGFCDIDHFKKINDTHGHDAGDRVLRAVSQSLLRVTEERCFVARHGGEEFVVVFRGKTIHQARELLDSIRRELEGRRMIDRKTNKPIGHVTFSAGLADVFAYADKRKALRAADVALYEAKGLGRNQIVIATY